jgi:hypothetical protein
MTTVCPRCGEPRVWEHQFCGKCGLDLEAIDRVAQPGSASNSEIWDLAGPSTASTKSAATEATVKPPRVSRTASSSPGQTILGCLFLLALLWGAWWLISSVFFHPSSQPTTVDTFRPAVTEVQAQDTNVTGYDYQDGLLMIRVSGKDWSDVGATNLACGTVKPILAAHEFGGQTFAIYDPTGKVISTGSRCP